MTRCTRVEFVVLFVIAARILSQALNDCSTLGPLMRKRHEDSYRLQIEPS
jgi:hypothetical protein